MEQKPYERVDADSAYAERLRDVLSRANVPAEQRVLLRRLRLLRVEVLWPLGRHWG